ncbi:MAG: prepilin-type N-terminal cleavage/methylation domain-containing protein [bacterium]|nr:prepilin-type N-terminal cleavage/methylation domain-containing protein [bacterium]
MVFQYTESNKNVVLGRIMKSTGFTLIELLIVVAIIGILAAIAVPNFLSARVKADLARVYADHKALSTAMEEYFLDQQSYPPSSHSENANWGSRLLTTPIPYMSRVLEDPFLKKYQASRGNDYDLVYEFNTASWPDYQKNGLPANIYEIESLGPDGYDNFESTRYPTHSAKFQFYDSTNGLISNGDILRTGGVYTPRWVRERKGGSFSAGKKEWI